MREIHVSEITRAVRDMAMRSCVVLGEDVMAAFRAALEKEESPQGKEVLRRILENAEIAKADNIPTCQDTGLAVLFVEVGQEVHIAGGSLREAVNEGVRQGYKDGYLRKSVADPFTRANSGDNTPALIHFDVVEGDHLKLTIAPKGGGSENMSRATIMPPSAGIPGIKEFVVTRVKEAGPNPCPPIIVGVGIGGNLEVAAIIGKKALLRPLGSVNPDPTLAKLEAELLEEINATGIGPSGLGGRVTALAVHCASYPTHIASLPVSVNIQCHAARHAEVEL